MASPFRRALLLNALVLAGAITCGWALSEQPAAAPLDSGPARATEIAFWPSVTHLFSRNLMVVGVVLLGACTFGMLTLVTLAWNGYQLGFGFSTLYMASSERAMWVMTYVPIEFSALLIAATVALELSRQLFLSLVYGHAFRPGPLSRPLFVAVFMLAAAAAIEVAAARAIARL